MKAFPEASSSSNILICKPNQANIQTAFHTIEMQQLLDL